MIEEPSMFDKYGVGWFYKKLIARRMWQENIFLQEKKLTNFIMI